MFAKFDFSHCAYVNIPMTTTPTFAQDNYILTLLKWYQVLQLISEMSLILFIA